MTILARQRSFAAARDRVVCACEGFPAAERSSGTETDRRVRRRHSRSTSGRTGWRAYAATPLRLTPPDLPSPPRGGNPMRHSMRRPLRRRRVVPPIPRLPGRAFASTGLPRKGGHPRAGAIVSGEPARRNSYARLTGVTKKSVVFFGISPSICRNLFSRRSRSSSSRSSVVSAPTTPLPCRRPPTSPSCGWTSPAVPGLSRAHRCSSCPS